MRLLILSTFALALTLGIAPRTALADGDCTVTEIRASNEGKGVDPRLKKIEAKLKAMPLKFDSFELLAEKKLATSKGQAAQTALVPKGTLSLTLKEEEQVKKKVRFHYDFKLVFQGGKTVTSVLKFDAGDTMFPFGGLPYKGGTYLIALSCLKK